MLVFLIAMMVIITQTIAQTPVKKYDIKSGIVTYDLIMKVGTMELKKKFIVYFDDYGMKECKETYSDNKLVQSYLSDGKDLYSLEHNKKKASKKGPAFRGTELRVEWSEFGTEKDRQSGKIKKVPAITVAGKSCEMFESKDEKGNITQYGGWNKILLLLDTQMQGTHSIQRAVKVEENVNVSPDKFKVPAGYTLQ